MLRRTIFIFVLSAEPLLCAHTVGFCGAACFLSPARKPSSWASPTTSPSPTDAARAFREQGADLAITYLNAKAEPHVRPLAEALGAEIILPLDVRNETEVDALYAAITERWGKLDTLLHSIAFCPKDDLHGRVVDCSAEGFGLAMDISVHSFLRLIRRAEPLMPMAAPA